MVEKAHKNIIFMKYGVHASESAESITKRKLEEIQACQQMYWGYGGTLCHPIHQVQPFLKDNLSKSEKTFLLLAQTSSQLNNPPFASADYSIDKITWYPIPAGIHVLGSKYAIVCKSIEQCDFCINLSKYTVPIGNSKGKTLSGYIQGRVDKACGRYEESEENLEPRFVSISLCAEIASPFSVFIR